MQIVKKSIGDAAFDLWLFVTSLWWLHRPRKIVCSVFIASEFRLTKTALKTTGDTSHFCLFLLRCFHLAMLTQMCIIHRCAVLVLISTLGAYVMEKIRLRESRFIALNVEFFFACMSIQLMNWKWGQIRCRCVLMPFNIITKITFFCSFNDNYRGWKKALIGLTYCVLICCKHKAWPISENFAENVLSAMNFVAFTKTKGTIIHFSHLISFYRHFCCAEVKSS